MQATPLSLPNKHHQEMESSLNYEVFLLSKPFPENLMKNSDQTGPASH